MKRPLIIAGVILLVLAGGLLAYVRLRPRPAASRGDPALTVAVAVGALLRSETHPLTAGQIHTVLPLLRVLRDTDPNDADASRALAEQIGKVFTPEQRAELDRLREAGRARRQQRQGQPGVPGAGPGGPGTPRAFGPGGRSRAELRQRLLSRLIARLEARE